MSILGSRAHHLSRLWSEYLAHKSLPKLDRWLAGAFRKQKKFGKNDRRWLSDHLFAAARYAYCAGFLQFAKAGPASDRMLEAYHERVADALSFQQFLRELAPEAFLQIIFSRLAWESDKHEGLKLGIPAQEDPPLSALAEFARNSISGLMLWHGIPLWWKNQILRRAHQSQWRDDQLRRFIELHSLRPPIWLRINSARKMADVIANLKEAGFNLISQEQELIAIEGQLSIYDLASFKAGYFEIQDFSSAMIGRTVQRAEPKFAWDVCAGAGGKTVQLAAASANRGAIFATEPREYKLEELKRRARRAGFHNIRTFVWQAGNPPPLTTEVKKHGGFDAVLVDAPCSGSGTWRRNPEGRFRTDYDLKELPHLQLQLLNDAARTLKPTGRLIYATCSFLAEEDEDLVKAFLSCNQGFHLESQTIHGSPETDSDLSFTAVLEKSNYGSPLTSHAKSTTV